MTELLRGHERKPAHPLSEGPRPGTRIKVQDNESWESVARKHGVTVKALIANNCGWNVSPEEINWYLHWRVGCNMTRDRRTTAGLSNRCSDPTTSGCRTATSPIPR